ncbi:MAG: serine hydrolase domain-containing protein, partial [Pseudobdellovibrio sp.]
VVLIQKDGQSVYEKYVNGYTENSPHLLWSTTKSVMSTVLAAAVQDGVLTIDDSICENIADKTPYGTTCDIKIRDLLSWSSGLAWSESYEGGDPTKSSVVQMLAGDGKFDMFQFFLSHPLANPPGTRFSYSTGDSTALMGALKLALQKKNLNPATYPWTALFNPLGVKATVETDKSGTFVGGALGYMTAKDLIKIGELYANNGIWNGKQILPEWWTKFALSTIPSYDPTTNQFFLPQYSWWRFNPKLAAPEIPPDTFFTLGHWGQYLIVIPSKNLIAVRFGDDRTDAFDLQKMVVLMLQNFDKPSAFVESDETPTPTAPTTPVYKTPIISIGTHLAANLICACVFVSQQTDDFCTNYAKAGGVNINSKIDRDNKFVESTFSGFQKAKSVWINEQVGCQLAQ